MTQGNRPENSHPRLKLGMDPALDPRRDPDSTGVFDTIAAKRRWKRQKVRPEAIPQRDSLYDVAAGLLVYFPDTVIEGKPLKGVTRGSLHLRATGEVIPVAGMSDKPEYRTVESSETEGVEDRREITIHPVDTTVVTMYAEPSQVVREPASTTQF